MNSDLVSVIIPTYRSLPLLKRTLNSLERQEPDPSAFEVVVSDDGSEDETAGWLGRYQGALRLKSILLSRNMGRSHARSCAVEAASGELLLLLDGDMEFGPQLVRRHQAKHPEGENLVVMGKVVYDRGLGRRGFARYIESRGGSKLPPGTPLPGRYFISSHVSLPKTLFVKAGGFDDRFKKHGGEDLDLGVRLVKSGANLIQDPNLTTTHLHIRALPEVMSSAREFGRHNIPLLLSKHPELMTELRLGWAEGSFIGRGLKKLLLSTLGYELAFRVALALNESACPAFIYDYLLYRNYLLGYKAHHSI